MAELTAAFAEARRLGADRPRTLKLYKEPNDRRGFQRSRIRSNKSLTEVGMNGLPDGSAVRLSKPTNFAAASSIRIASFPGADPGESRISTTKVASCFGINANQTNENIVEIVNAMQRANAKCFNRKLRFFTEDMLPFSVAFMSPGSPCRAAPASHRAASRYRRA